MKYSTFLFAVLSAALPAMATTAITSCGTQITNPGNYVLTTDLINCPGVGINILASSVTVSLNGHRITGPGTGSFQMGISIAKPNARLDHVAIQGPGLLQGWTIGVSSYNCDYCQVSLLTTSKNAQGIEVNQATFLTIASDIASQNSYVGIQLNYDSNAVIQFNDASGNGNYGIFDNAGSANTINNNTANGNGNGIGIGDASGDRVFANVANSNKQYGIQLTSLSQGIQVTNNTSARANLTADLQDDSTACGSGIWSNNSFLLAAQSCIH